MMCRRVRGFALATLVCAVGSGDVVADGSNDVTCTSGDHVISARGAAYDGPGGAKIRELPAGSEYVAVATLHHTDGEDWMLLTDRSGGHVGWILQKAVERGHNPIKCTVPLERLIRSPR
jgi:hypothetical protein